MGGSEKKKEIPIAQIMGIVMLTWALVPSNPYGYYVVLRWVICGILIYLALEAYGLKKIGWVWVLGIAAAIYNPIIRVHSTREVWSFVNLATIALLTITIWVVRKTKKEGG